jgi:hypothetical protein
VGPTRWRHLETWKPGSLEVWADATNQPSRYRDQTRGSDSGCAPCQSERGMIRADQNGGGRTSTRSSVVICTSYVPSISPWLKEEARSPNERSLISCQLPMGFRQFEKRATSGQEGEDQRIEACAYLPPYSTDCKSQPSCDPALHCAHSRLLYILTLPSSLPVSSASCFVLAYINHNHNHAQQLAIRPDGISLKLE